MGPLEVCGHAFESENGQLHLGDRCRCLPVAIGIPIEAVVLHWECQEEGIAKGVDAGKSAGQTTGWKQTGPATGRRTSIICVMIRVCFRRMGIIL